MATNHAATPASYLRFLLTLALTVGILYVAKPFLVPLVLAVLLTFILSPIVISVQTWGLGRVPAVLLTVAMALTLIGVIGWGVGVQVSGLARELPEKKGQIKHKIAEIRGSGEGVFGGLLQTLR